MRRSTDSRPIILTGVVVLLTALAAVGVPAAADEPHEVRHTDNLRLVDREAFPFGTDLAFNGDLVAAGSGAWEGEAFLGVHLFRRWHDGTLLHLGTARCASWHGDVDFVTDRFVVQSHDDGADNAGCEPGEGAEGVRVIDIRNPNKPRSVGFAETIHGSHNLTAVGDTGLVYVSSYNLRDPGDVDGVSIVDVGADPESPPVRFLEFGDLDDSSEHDNMRNDSGDVPGSMGCHDIGLDLERDLAFCAGITETQIWDISHPRDPVIIEIVRNPGISIHHGAQVNAEGDVLIINDEWLGAAGANTGCLVPGQPSGALWFHDISDPRDARPLSYWSPPQSDPSEDFCTSHFFGTFPDRDVLVTSWYDHGIWVVDFSDPSSPTTAGSYEPDGATFWSAYPYRGRLYANSFAPATFTGSDQANADQGGIWVLELDGYDLPRRGHRRR